MDEMKKRPFSEMLSYLLIIVTFILVLAYFYQVLFLANP